MKWDYDNEQWARLPGHIKHLPLFTRHFDLLSYFFRVLWAIFLKFIFKVYIKLEVKGDLGKILKENPRLLIISNHASHLDAVSIAAAIPFNLWTDLYMRPQKIIGLKILLLLFFKALLRCYPY